MWESLGVFVVVMGLVVGEGVIRGVVGKVFWDGWALHSW